MGWYDEEEVKKRRDEEIRRARILAEDKRLREEQKQRHAKAAADRKRTLERRKKKEEQQQETDSEVEEMMARFNKHGQTEDQPQRAGCGLMRGALGEAFGGGQARAGGMHQTGTGPQITFKPGDFGPKAPTAEDAKKKFGGGGSGFGGGKLNRPF